MWKYVIRCKRCSEFSVNGLENEFGEKFCTEKCYKLYCEANGYEPHVETLKPVIKLD